MHKVQTEKPEPTNVLSFTESKKKRDLEEERRLERLVIERWRGNVSDYSVWRGSKDLVIARTYSEASALFDELGCLDTDDTIDPVPDSEPISIAVTDDGAFCNPGDDEEASEPKTLTARGWVELLVPLSCGACWLCTEE